MTMVEVPVQIKVPDLFKAIEQLPATELEELLLRIRLLQKRHQDDTSLLELIYHPIPAEQRARLNELGAKLEAETISEAEREELLKLVELSETADVERSEALLVLAERRGITTRELLRALKLGPDLGYWFNCSRPGHDRSASPQPASFNQLAPCVIACWGAPAC